MASGRRAERSKLILEEWVENWTSSHEGREEGKTTPQTENEKKGGK